jgi:hypothetical protein
MYEIENAYEGLNRRAFAEGLDSIFSALRKGGRGMLS